MSSRVGGVGSKRRMQQQVEGGRGEPAAMQVTAQPEPLTLLAVVKLFYGMLVWLQLCNSQGVALLSFVLVPPRMPCPLAGAPVYGMSLTHAERLRMEGCGFKGKLVGLLSLGVGCHVEPQRNWGACCKMMQSIVRRVAAGLAAAVRDKVAKEAEELCASGECAAAAVPLQRAVDWGDWPSRALKAWLLIHGREGVAKDEVRGFELAEEGVRLGCHHCQGVMALGYWYDNCYELDYAQSLELAHLSSGKGSRYGQLALGELHYYGDGGLAVDHVQAAVLYRLAAAQGLDEAQFTLGCIYHSGNDVAQDDAEALRWLQLAATQGLPQAIFMVAGFHERGLGVRKNKAAAIRWYRRAQAAGYKKKDFFGESTEDALRRLRA
jgi:hypothetical protein